MKPLIEIVVVNIQDGTKTKTTLDFDGVMGISPYSQKVRGVVDGAPAIINGTMVMLKNSREMFVVNPYEELSDQWIKLTHPCTQITKCLTCGTEFNEQNSVRVSRD